MAEQRSTLVIEIDSRNAERNARNIARELQSIERTGDFATRSMDSMSVATRSLVGYMGGLVTVGAAVSKMDTYTGLRNRLKLVTDSQVDLNTAMNDTFAIAQKTASSWDSTAMVYQRFADNADRLGISMKQTAALTETVSKAISVSGGSAASAEAALMQFGQALASGVLRGEEFNSIAEQAPGLLKAIAFGLDTNVGSLRAMAGEGKITGDVLVAALGKAKPYIDDLFNRTDFTISQSFTKLSNEVTKFVGEAGAGSGAAAGLSAAIDGLAQNLGTIANIAVVGGVALLTKTILAQTAAVYGSITASTLRRNNLLAELATQAAGSAAEVRRTAALAQFTAMQLADAKATAARMTGVQRLAYVQATVIPLEAKATQALAAHTAVTASDTIVQNANNTARSRGAALLALVGGPIGAITIGVAALAAGYMYLKSRTDEANAKLEEQGKIAQETDEELRKLSGNDRISAVRDLTDAFNDQNEKLAKSKESVDAVLFSIRAVSVENEAARKVTEDARKGIISYDEAIKRLNNMDIPTDLYDMLKKQVIQYDENSEKASNSQRVLKILGVEFKLTGNEAQNASSKIAGNTKELNANETAAQKAARAQQGFKDSLYDREYEAYVTKGLLAKGYSEEQVKAMVDAANYAKKEGIEITNEMYQAALKVVDIEQKNKDVIDARNKAQKENTNEITKQQKVLQASAKVQANAAKYNFGGLESKYSLPSGMLSALHAIETGNSGKTNQVNKKTGATGGFQFLKGTAGQYGVKDRTDMAQSVEGAAKYMSYLLKLFKGDLEKAVRAYHAGEGNVQEGKNIGKYNNDYWQKFKGYSAGVNGYSAGDISSKDFEKILEDAAKLTEEQAKLRKSVELDVANEVTKIRENLKDKLIEIDSAGFSPERTKELRSEYQSRADNDIAIAQYALKAKLDDYSAFKKTESELLEDSFNEKKFYASRDIELSKDQRDKAVVLLNEQLKQEQAALILARETRIFQFEQTMYTEMDLIKKRYDFELREAARVSDPEERSRRINAASFNKKDSENDVLINTTLNYKSALGQDVSADRSAIDRQAAIDQMYENGFIKQQEYELRSKQSREQYNLDMMNLQLNYGQQVTGALSGMFGAMLGESSSAYRTLYGAQKSFALAQAGMNVWKAASDAYANEPGTVWQKMGAAAIATLEGGKFVALIEAATPKGFKSGGYTGNYGVNQEAGVVHGQEYVLNAAATKRVGVGALDAINSGKSIGGGGDIKISQTLVFNGDGSAKVDTQGQKDVAQSLQNMMDAWARRESRQGGVLYKLAKG